MQISGEALVLLRGEIMAVSPHQRDQAAIPVSGRVYLLPAGQEVAIDSADHMKAIGYDARLRKVFTYQSAVACRQIHADDLNQVFAIQAAEVILQRGFAAAEHHVMHFVILQITESRGIAVPPCEEVLVDAQNPDTPG